MCTKYCEYYLPVILYEPWYINTKRSATFLVVVLVNRAVSLECPVEGTPKPSIKWVVNDQSLTTPGQFIKFSAAKTQLHLLRYDHRNNLFDMLDNPRFSFHHFPLYVLLMKF